MKCFVYVHVCCKCAESRCGLNMDMPEGNAGGRLPTTHARRIQLRDAKMWRRETDRQLGTGSRTSRCPCTLCMFGRPLLRATQAKHLRDYGRHPARRLQEEVKSNLVTGNASVCTGVPHIIMWKLLFGAHSHQMRESYPIGANAAVMERI